MYRNFMSIVVTLGLVGCVSSPPMQFTVVSLSDEKPEVEILGEDVVGEDCPGGLSGYGSYSVATKRAVSSVDGANALINVDISRKEMPLGKICVKVKGDAVRL